MYDKTFCTFLSFTVNTWFCTGIIFDGYSDCQIVDISSIQVELHRCGEQSGICSNYEVSEDFQENLKRKLDVPLGRGLSVRGPEVI